jgi:hypothetical protein
LSSPEFQSTLAAMLRDISRLAAGISLDRATDPTRVLPVIPPAHAWRVWPRIARRAADLADALAAAEEITVQAMTRAESEFLRNVATIIERAEGAANAR